MELGSIFLLLAVLIAVVLFISWPLIERARNPLQVTNQDVSALLARRDQVVVTIQELDDDYALGKIPTENYPEQRAALVRDGADILRQLDTVQPVPSSGAAEDRLEESILLRRQALETASAPPKTGSAVPPVPDDELEQRIASRRRELNEKAGGFCPKCGRPVYASDRFCPKCGASLA